MSECATNGIPMNASVEKQVDASNPHKSHYELERYSRKTWTLTVGLIFGLYNCVSEV